MEAWRYRRHEDVQTELAQVAQCLRLTKQMLFFYPVHRELYERVVKHLTQRVDRLDGLYRDIVWC